MPITRAALSDLFHPQLFPPTQPSDPVEHFVPASDGLTAASCVLFTEHIPITITVLIFLSYPLAIFRLFSKEENILRSSFAFIHTVFSNVVLF